MIVNDIDIFGPYRVIDARSGSPVFSWPGGSAPGDMPPDVAILPVSSVRMDDDTMIIFTEV